MLRCFDATLIRGAFSLFSGTSNAATIFMIHAFIDATMPLISLPPLRQKDPEYWQLVAADAR